MGKLGSLHVEKRERVPLENEEIVNILKRHNVGRYVRLERSMFGYQSDNYLIRTSRGRFLLKVFYGSAVSSNSFSDILKTTEYLALHGVRTPRPIRTRSRKLSIFYKGHTVSLQTFIEGKSHMPRPTVKMFKQFGKELGIVDKLLYNYKFRNQKFSGGPVKFVANLESKQRLTCYLHYMHTMQTSNLQIWLL